MADYKDYNLSRLSESDKSNSSSPACHAHHSSSPKASIFRSQRLFVALSALLKILLIALLLFQNLDARLVDVPRNVGNTAGISPYSKDEHLAIHVQGLQI